MSQALPSSAVERDALLAALLAQLAEQQRNGSIPEVEAVAREHPEFADELRTLWMTAQLADELTRTVCAPSAPNGNNRTSGPIGDCELIEELGRGGMGVVYRARQRALNRTVALKILSAGAKASEIERARFQAEASAAAQLDHPHIVPVYAVGEHDEQPYFLMKLIEGHTLAQRLIDGPLQPREAARLLVPICRAIDYAHRNGVLHRDLKPSNILIDRDDTPFVADFGLAKRVETDSDLTRTGALVGTPSYMAPEQASRGRGQLGPASDVFSLGAILYQMLTGRPPFQAASALDTIFLVLEQDPLPPRLLNPRADPDLELIALKCLQKPVDLRYATAAALADDLEAYIAGNPVSARSGRFTSIVSRAFRETHHAAVLESWGLLWMWHSLVLLFLCVLTNVLQLSDVRSPAPYLFIWTVGLGTWAAIFWSLRRRSGPVTFVERQIAHIWAASVIGCTCLFGLEKLLGLPVLTLAPVLALFGGMVFLVKAGILSGAFDLPAAVLFVTSVVMANWPRYGLTIYGLISALCFFIPGLKYYRRRRDVAQSMHDEKKVD